ncbi:MAG TPA: hypothetical protein VJ654_08565 [Noviherbaspirillum sp.]|nr:hypothetical protein [Noviherbaspirillum sp.]HJW55776.1 hypothetical protein [Burkholderiaceae bacterium]
MLFLLLIYALGIAAGAYMFLIGIRLKYFKDFRSVLRLARLSRAPAAAAWFGYSLMYGGTGITLGTLLILLGCRNAAELLTYLVGLTLLPLLVIGRIRFSRTAH